MTFDPENDTFEILMRHCPSKGQLLEFEHLEPYEFYCEHCQVLYERVVSPLGYDFVVDMSNCDKAACKCTVRPKKKP